MNPGAALRSRASTYAIAAVLAGSLLTCLRGVAAHRDMFLSAWGQPHATLLVGSLLAAGLLVLFALARWRRLPVAAVFGLAGLSVAAVFAGPGPAVVVVLQTLAAFCLGRRLFPLVEGEPNDELISVVVATAAGFALLSLVIGVASFFPINNRATYLALLVLPLVIGARANFHALRSAALAVRTASAEPGRWATGLMLLVLFTVLLRLLAVLHPELGEDALAMHLVIAEQLRTEGLFHFDVTRSIWAVMPMAGDWQFAIANMLGGEYAARLLNLVSELLVLAGIYLACARHRSALAGAVAVLVYATLPLAYLETTSLFVENFWTLWMLGALLAGIASLGRGGARAAACAGFLVGTALATKLVTVFAAPLFLAIAIAWLRASPREGLRKLGIFSAVALLAGGPTYVNAWLRTGNPVFPFVNDVFKSPFFESAHPFKPPGFDAGIDWWTLYRVTFESSKFLESAPGAVGLALLVLLPAALLHALLDSTRTRVAALGALAFVALAFTTTSYLRYVLPMMPVLAMLIGIMVAGMSARVRWLREPLLLVVLGCGLAGIYLTPTANYHHRRISIPPFAGSPAESDYLMEWRPERQVAQAINAARLHKVLWLGLPTIAQTGADVHLVNWHGGFAERLQFDALADEKQLKRWITKQRFDGIVIASGFNACEREFVCKFLDDETTLAFQAGSASLRLTRPEMMFTHERLTNPDFARDTTGWSGGGRFDAADGAVRVTAAAPFVQSVSVQGGGRYLLQVDGRCTPDKAPYRSQVNWIDANGVIVRVDIAVVDCTGEFRKHIDLLQAPREARKANVYATGHDPVRTAEISRVSLRTP